MFRNLNLVAICFLCINLLAVENHTKTSKLILHFFGSETCGECFEIKEKVLAPYQKSHPAEFEYVDHHLENENDFKLLDAMEKEYKVVFSAPEQLFFPDTFLSGYEAITRYGPKIIEDYLADRNKWTVRHIKAHDKEFSGILNEKFQKFTFIGILAAGLVDGVNPCAIATLIFLISFLAVKKRNRKEILVIGFCFTSAVFVTYLLLGIGAFRIIVMFESYRLFSKLIKWTAVLFAGAVSIISFWDAIMYSKKGDAREIKLQLPKPVKLRIHKVISANLSGSQLVMGSIVTGFLVTLLEAVCTGQVYLPTIILMTRQGGLKVTGWLYLILYNFLFVLPLIVIMVLAYYGLTWNRLSKLTKKHLSLLKFLLGTVLAALAVFLAVSM